MKLTIVAGARPNFMKIAPIIKAIGNARNSNPNLSFRLVHTGQHYDKSMSGNFFTQLDIPETISMGTNELIGTNPKNLGIALRKLLSGHWKKGGIPPMWDGKTAERIVDWFVNQA